jgi:ubiquinone/menaquinone biosynthesis C-methylase UbiE
MKFLPQLESCGWRRSTPKRFARNGRAYNPAMDPVALKRFVENHRAAEALGRLTDLRFLAFEPDFSSPQILAAYDELPLWSAMFGLLLLDEVPLRGVTNALDVGCGTGFPLIELAERLGPQAHVHGIDPWSAGLARAAEKITSRATPNVTLHEGSASSMPFADAAFDLIVSNLGVNNFDDRSAAIRECRRVARDGATLALTTNLQGHMKEFYDVFEEVLQSEGEDARQRLRAHIEHRATIADVRELLESGGFTVTRVVEREGVMRFADGTALFNHHFIKLGFLDSWKKVVPGREHVVFTRLRDALNDLAARQGELRLTIPMAYIEASASEKT